MIPPVKNIGYNLPIFIDSGDNPLPGTNFKEENKEIENEILKDDTISDVLKWLLVGTGLLVKLKIIYNRLKHGTKVVEQIVHILKYFNTVTLPGIIYMGGILGQTIGLIVKSGWFMVRAVSWPARIFMLI